MTSSPKKPGVAFWATVVVVVALTYPLSFGPACRLACGHHAIVKSLCYFYWPLVSAAKGCQSDWPENALQQYGAFCHPAGYEGNAGLAVHEWVLGELF